ncbi:hypothetical protein KM043_013823 [Ampulex compressa]|nr:hypothetical protein KM043_013823 [Ampulex compressa]
MLIWIAAVRSCDQIGIQPLRLVGDGSILAERDRVSETMVPKQEGKFFVKRKVATYFVDLLLGSDPSELSGYPTNELTSRQPPSSRQAAGVPADLI